MNSIPHTIPVSNDVSYPADAWERREVRPEALDLLNPSNPAALRSRAEIAFVNTLMGNHRWLLRHLKALWQPGLRLLELGPGNGALAQRIVATGAWPARDIIGIDTTPRASLWPGRSAWIQGDVLHDPLPGADVIISNLLLHQFKREELMHLGSRIPASCTCILAVEPARSRFALLLGRIVAYLCQLHPVTVHDMILSVHAGFRNTELADALSLDNWECSAESTLRGACRVLLKRASAPQ